MYHKEDGWNNNIYISSSTICRHLIAVKFDSQCDCCIIRNNGYNIKGNRDHTSTSLCRIWIHFARKLTKFRQLLSEHCPGEFFVLTHDRLPKRRIKCGTNRNHCLQFSLQNCSVYCLGESLKRKRNVDRSAELVGVLKISVLQCLDKLS